MSRHVFGPSPDMLVWDAAGNVVAGALVRLYPTYTGGDQVTDLLKLDDTPITGGDILSSDGTDAFDVGEFAFKGPDGVTELWVDFGSGKRKLIRANDAGGITGAGAVSTVNDIEPDGNGNVALVASDIPNAVADTRTIIAGSGLTGGGPLTSDPTLSANFGTSAGTVAQGDDSRLSDARTPTAHTHPATDVSDSTSVGRSVLTAADAAAARAAIGANPVVDTTVFAVKSGSVGQFADWSTDAPFDLGVPRYDTETGTYVPTDLAGAYAEVDPSTGRILTAAEPKYYVPIAIVNEGSNPPADFPPHGIVFSRPAAPSLIPVLNKDGFSQGSNTLVLTTTEVFNVDDNICLVIGGSGESTPTAFPATFTLGYGTGAGAVTLRASGQQAGTSQTEIWSGKITTQVPAGTNLTITSTGGNRVHILAAVFRLPNIAASNPFDKAAVAASGSSANLAFTVGPTSTPISQANEVGIAAFTFNSGTGATVRTLAGTNGWQQLSNFESESGSARSLAVFYKTFTAVGTVSGTAQMTSSDAASGAWSGALATFKAA